MLCNFMTIRRRQTSQAGVEISSIRHTEKMSQQAVIRHLASVEAVRLPPSPSRSAGGVAVVALDVGSQADGPVAAGLVCCDFAAVSSE